MCGWVVGDGEKVTQRIQPLSYLVIVIIMISHDYHHVIIQGDFFNWASPENVIRLAPLKNASTGPPYFEKVLSMAAGRGEIPNTLTFSILRGGPV